ncbi:GntR family transcriptional regulator [Rhodococcus sp. WS4]|nr:GntR family transcriptional regulator [Rhodococcus sp. WS4]
MRGMMAEKRTLSPEIGWRKQDWAYAQVRDWIISGELAPGTRIDQEELAGRIGISRIPLREALARLIAEGFLQGAAHRRVVVTSLSLIDARDVYCGREALESALAGAAAQNAASASEELGEVARILDKTELLLETGDAEEFRNLDRTFHEGIYQIANMPKSFGSARSLYAMSERYVRLYLSDSARIAASYAEHVKIYQAVKAGDAASAAGLTCSHVATGLSLLEVRLAA